MLKSINKNIAVLLTIQTFISPLAFAAENTADVADTFAIKASNALAHNDFSDLEVGSATFNYSDNSKAYVKVSDLTVNTTAEDGSTSSVNLGKQYEVCSVSSDSRTVNCNYTTVSTDGSKSTKSLSIDNTAEHQIYSIPNNASYTDTDKKYFVTSFDNPYYKFRATDADGHIAGTNCIKLNSNSMVCSADASVDMSKLSASDFAQIDNTEKYQVNTDKLTNAMLTTSTGACAIDGWVQADATHCCPPNTAEYSYSWDTAQQQCKVTKHNAQKENKNNLLKDLLSAGAIFAGSMPSGKNKETQTTGYTTTELNEDTVYQNAKINKNAEISIKFNPQIPVSDNDLKATIKVKSAESDKLIIRLQAPSSKIDTLTAHEDKEFTLISADKIETGKYKLIVYVMNDSQRIATFEASFEVFDSVTVLTDEQKKQYTEIHPTQISEEIEQFSIAGDVSNVNYDEENSICSFDLSDGYAQTCDTSAFKIEESMPVEMLTDRESCDGIKASNKVYVENGLLHKDGNRFGVIVNSSSNVLTDVGNSYYTNSEDELNAELEAINKAIGDVSTIQTPAGAKVVSAYYDEAGIPVIEDTASGDIYYSLSDFAEANDIDADTLVAVQHKYDDGTTISRVYIDDGSVSNVFTRDAFNAKYTDMSNTIKKASSIRDFTPNMLNSAEFKKKEKENIIVKSIRGCFSLFSESDEMKEVRQNISKHIADMILKS